MADRISRRRRTTRPGGKIVILAAVAAAAIGGAATARSHGSDDEAGLARALAGLRPGQPQLCMPNFGASPALTAYGPVLVYTLTRGDKYVTRTTGGCEGVARGDVLVTQQIQARKCAGDIATTVDPVSRFPTGSCTIGKFTEYRK